MRVSRGDVAPEHRDQFIYVYVAYTSNPSPGSGVETEQWREGPPVFLGAPFVPNP